MDAEELIDMALYLIGTSPLPDNSYEIIMNLQEQAPSDSRWPWIWEGFVVAGGKEPGSSS